MMKKDLVGALLAFVVPLLVFTSNLDSGWVLDDNWQLVGNPTLRSFTNLPRVLSKEFWEFGSPEVYGSYAPQPGSNAVYTTYRPVLMISYMTDYYLFGLRPFWFHLVNDVLHALNCVLLFVLARRFLSFGFALLGVLPFALHPIGVEAVTWVAARTDLLGTLFGLANVVLMLGLLDFTGKRRFTHWICFGLTVPLGLFSKESFVMVPVATLLGNVVADADRGPRRNRYARVAMILGIVTGLTLLVRGWIVGAASHGSLLTLDHLRNFVLILRRFMYLWFVPSGTDFFNVFKPVPFEWRRDLFPILAWLLVVSSGLWLGRKSRGFLTGAALFIAPLVPVTVAMAVQGLLPERYLYFPLAGFSLMFGVVLSRLSLRMEGLKNRALGRVFSVLLVLWLSSLALATISRNRDWHDEARLYTRSMEQDPGNPLPHYRMAWHHARSGDRNAEIQSYYAALARNPEDVPSLSNLAVRLIEQGELGKAEEFLLRAHVVEPGRAKTAFNLGVLWENRGDLPKARRWYRKAMELDPDYRLARAAIERVTPAGTPR